VFDEVNKQEVNDIGLVHDGSIYYLVLNREDNTFREENLLRLLAIVD